MEKKLMFSPDELCYGLPEEFSVLLKYARKLDFMETPDYDGIKNMFKDLLNDNKGFFDVKFCWESDSEFEDDSDEVKDKNCNQVENKVNK